MHGGIIKKTFHITASAGANGSISPSGPRVVPVNGSIVFTITPNSGYSVDSVYVDGVSDSTAAANGTKTFSSVAANHTISVTFNLGVHLPFTDGFSGSSLSANWTQGGTWTVSGSKASNAPASGNNLLTNGGMEGTFVDGLAPGWNTYQMTPTVAVESTIVYSGGSSQKITTSLSNDGIRQDITFTLGAWYTTGSFVYISSGGYAQALAYDGSVWHVVNTVYLGGLSGQWMPLFMTFYSHGSGGHYCPKLLSAGGGAQYFYADSASTRIIMQSTLYATVQTGVTDVTVSDALVVRAGTQGGVVISYSDPANLVLAYYDNEVFGAKLDKCVAGTWSNVISQGAGFANYTANAIIQVIKSGTTYTLKYNGSTIGSPATISDAAIISNTKHGIFSTFGLNTVGNFRVSR